MRWFTVIGATVVLTLLVGGIWYASRPSMGEGASVFDPCRSSSIAGGAEQIGGPFTLINKDGQEVTDQDVITGPSLLYFGYTFCPDICPLDVVRNADAVDLLAERGMDVTPVFISVDPERDTPEVVGDFAFNVSDRMVGLTGTPEQVKAASKAYRTYYQKQESGDEYYLMNHSTYSYLVLPPHGFVEFFNRDLTPEQLADRAACFIEKT